MNRNQVFFKLRAHDTKNAPNLYSSKKRNVWRGGDVGDMLTCPPLALSSWMGLISGDHSAVDPPAFPPFVSPLHLPTIFSHPISSPFSSSHLPHSLSLITPSSFTQQEFGRGLRVCARVCVARGQPAPVSSRGLRQGQHRGLCPCLTPWK